ncbi:hypothetical protein N9J01_00305 [bacterium]|nr:hypothetical protein [bacterium]
MANTYLQRTPSSTTNRKTFTISTWFKRSNITGATQRIFEAAVDGSSYTDLRIKPTEAFSFYTEAAGIAKINLTTNRVLRDTSAWYHVVIAVDTTQGTASDRVKMYINGVQETSFATATYPDQNFDTYVNYSSAKNVFGRRDFYSDLYFDGSMSHVHLIDGTAYDATAFGEYDTNGVWTINTSPSVTYGTNGFFILKDGNSVTDQSGNSNNFTVAGGTLTKTEDSPSNVFATMNPLDQTNVGGSSATMTNGNLTWQSSSNNTSQNGMRGTVGLTQGKWYWEVKYIAKSSGNDDFSIGICGSEANLNVGGSGDILEGANPNVMWLTRNDNSSVKKNSSDVTTGLTDANIGDIIMLAVDMDNLKFFVGINGTWLNSANPVTGANAPSTIDANTYLPAVSNYGYSYARTLSFNFGNGYFGTTPVASAGTNASGNGIFEYDVPTGYTALSTKGLNL